MKLPYGSGSITWRRMPILSNSACCGHVRYVLAALAHGPLDQMPIVSGSQLRYRPTVFGWNCSGRVIANANASIAPV